MNFVITAIAPRKSFFRRGVFASSKDAAIRSFVELYGSEAKILKVELI